MVEHAAGGPEVAQVDQPGPADAQAGAPRLVDVAEVQVLGLVLLHVVEQGLAARLGPAGAVGEQTPSPGPRADPLAANASWLTSDRWGRLPRGSPPPTNPTRSPSSLTVSLSLWWIPGRSRSWYWSSPSRLP